jgi:uncharacterized membrane protein
MNDFDELKKVLNELVNTNVETAKSNESIIEMIEGKRKQSFLSSIIRKKNCELTVSAIAMAGLLLYQEYRGFASFLTFTLMEIALFLCFIQSFIQSRILAKLQFPDTVISLKKCVDKYKKTVHIFRVALVILVALIVFSILFNEIVYSLKLVIIACVGLIVCFCYIWKAINQENKEMNELTEIVS